MFYPVFLFSEYDSIHVFNILGIFLFIIPGFGLNRTFLVYMSVLCPAIIQK
uniref:Uncharacterized protein n=1 Tax=Meloidogyne incognita TaxID=6306 RepID=A0A914KPU1_MELIC